MSYECARRISERRWPAVFVAACFAFPCIDETEVAKVVGFARGANLAEDDAIAAKLEQSLSPFLDALRGGDWDDRYSDPDERERYAFFYDSLQRGAKDAEPIVLKSYPVENGSYMVTVAFMVGAPKALAISRIAEFEAIPAEEGFAFRCPYERRTADLQRRTIGAVTFRFRGAFDEERAAEFARFQAAFAAQQGRDPEPLQYDCFQSLDELLKAHGLVHDANKCNFLRHDLGFLWDDGQRFATGTGDERYIFGYVCGVLAAEAADPEQIYWPYVNGVAAYYGGYGLSGDSMEDLARQFRQEFAANPTINFLEEFQKGRAASIHRHFSYYVMCAFLCQEIIAQHGEVAALQLVNTGANGERFFWCAGRPDRRYRKELP